MTDPVIDMVHGVVNCLVDDEDAIVIRSVKGEANIVLEVSLSPTDVGKVIGREGVHIKALRQLLAAVSRKYRRTYTISIVEPERRRAN